ncbi:MAG: chromosomal replication initiator protein DnaA [Desulfobulbaceae bacterium]|nr:chromosomal replication initiator protein DnaA [Desulfobulbaceae bacterium]HIJ79457.1 chromosomal replication initiator protein DnaA [Deltaproteobacteria bacterium]
MLWQSVKSILSEKLSDSDLALWIEPLAFNQPDAKTIELAGPDRYCCSWVADNFLTSIEEALAQVGAEDVKVRLTVASPQADRLLAVEPDKRQEQLRLPSMPPVKSQVRALHPRYTFDEFMVGDSNALAHSACEAIANGDDTLGPCLFIEAATGLGKSHLTHAVAHHILNHSPSTRLHYLTSQQLTAEMVRNIKSNTMEQFKEKYHNNCDVLLMEDVQSLAGRNKTQAELAEALDILMESGKRVIFTGSVSPRQIPNMDEGVSSRMASGLVSTINPPDSRTRRLIIDRKSRNGKLQLSDDIIDFMADNIKGDIRQLESALVGLRAKASLLKTVPDLDMVKELVAGLVGHHPELSVVMIRDFVAGQFNLSVDELQSKSRKKTVTFPRQVSMYLARKMTEQALSDIGKAFNRDHSTVVHSIRVITEAIARNGSIRGQVEHLADRIKKQTL